MKVMISFSLVRTCQEILAFTKGYMYMEATVAKECFDENYECTLFWIAYDNLTYFFRLCLIVHQCQKVQLVMSIC